MSSNNSNKYIPNAIVPTEVATHNAGGILDPNYDSGNLFGNAAADILRLGTGNVVMGLDTLGTGVRNVLNLPSIVTGKKQIEVPAFGQAVIDRTIQQINDPSIVLGDNRFINTAASVGGDLLGMPIGMTADDYSAIMSGEMTPAEFNEKLKNWAGRNPVSMGFNFAPSISAGAGKTTAVVSRGRNVSAAFSAKQAKASQAAAKRSSVIQEITKDVPKEVLPEVIYSARTGKPIRPELQKYKDIVKTQMEKYHNIIPEDRRIDSMTQFINQKAVRESMDLGDMSKIITEIEADKMNRPYHELRQNGRNMTINDLQNELDTGATSLTKDSAISDYVTGIDNTQRNILGDSNIKVNVTKDLPNVIDGNVDRNTFIKAESTLSQQPKNILDGLSKILDNDELIALKDISGENLVSALESRFGSKQAMMDNLSKVGINGLEFISGKGKDIGFNAKKGAEYNRKTQTIRYNDSTDMPTMAHEASHYFLDLLESIKNDNPMAASYLTKIKESLGLNPEVKLSVKNLEDIADAIKNNITEGKPLTPAIQQFVDDFGLNKFNKKGITEIQDLANGGDTLAKSYIDGVEAFNRGDGFVVSALGADPVITQRGVKANNFGRFGDRLNGTQTDEAIAKQMLDPDSYLNKVMVDETELSLADELLRGKIAGEDMPTPTNPIYLNRELVAEGKLSEAINKATNASSKADDIALDSSLAKDIDNQLKNLRGTNPYEQGIAADVYSIGKQVALGTGRYLTGNAQTGLFNLIINEGLNPISAVDDIIASINTKGNLAKSLGTYRNPRQRNAIKGKTPIGDAIISSNKPVSNFMSGIDARMQNVFAEIAANHNLREKGVPITQRQRYIESAPTLELTNIIDDVRNVALLNSTKSILKDTTLGRGYLAFEPFAEWKLTAVKSFNHMLKKQPLIMNYLFINGLNRIALDEELQRRERLNVKSNKPFVSYRYNPRTQDIEEVSAEISPQINTLKMFGSLAAMANKEAKKAMGEDTAFSTTLPVVSDIMGAIKGVNRYGKPLLRYHKDVNDMLRIQGDRRYKYNASTGQLEEIKSSQLDEVTTAVARNLSVYPNLFNTTAGAIGSTVLSIGQGKEVPFYRPYPNSLFGSFDYNNGNFLFSGNPTSQVTPQTLSDMIMGTYARPYYEERQYMSPTQYRSLQRNMFRRYMRESEATGGQE